MEPVAPSGLSQHVQVFSNNPWVLFLSLPNDQTISMGSHNLTSKIIRMEEYPFACGGYADVYRAKYIDDSGRALEVYHKSISRHLIFAEGSIPMPKGSSKGP